ncbi:hypothetical protein HK101_011101 [Irineochytrium annulatum]|nr:hypothetical protein HK101_011101 [Irineochytrium annulatum]
MIVTQGWLDRLVMDAYGNLIWKPRHALLCQRGFSCSLLLHKSSGSSASKRISLDVATTATGRGECGWVLFSGGGEYVFRCQGGVAERDAWVDAVARVVGQSGVGRVMDEMAGGEGVVELERPVRRMPMVSMDVERMFEDLFVQLDVAKREHDPNTAAASKTGGVNIRRTKSSGDMVTAASAAWKGEVVANDIRRAGSAAGVQKDLPTFPPDLRESAVETSGRPSTDSRRHSATCPTDDRTSNSLSPSSFDAIRRPSESSPATVASGSRRPSATTTETDDHLGVASEFRRPSNLSSASGSRRPSNMTDRTCK